MRRRIFAPAFFAGLLHAQISGTLLDPAERPVAGARITCAGRSTLSGVDGRFEISGADRCAARIEAGGFATLRADLENGRAATLRLALASLSERVVVSATRLETTVEEAGVAATLVEAAELERRQYPFVLDLLREIPGLHVARFGRQGAATQVFARGSQRTGTLLMIDGVPVNDPGGDLNFAHLMSSAVERVEVVRGPESALFGAEASAAVIQLFTRQGDPERKVPRGSLFYERGSFQTDRWAASLAGGSGARLDYSLNSEQFHTVGEFPNDHYRNTTGSASLGYRLGPATRVRALLRSFDSTVGVPNRVAYRIFDFDAQRRNRDYTASLRLDDARGQRYSQRISGLFHRLRDTFDDQIRDGPYTVAGLVTGASRVTLVELIDPRRLPLAPAEIPPGTRLVTRSGIRLAPSPSLSVTSREGFEYQGTLAHANGAAVFGYEYERQSGRVSGLNVDRGNQGAFAHKQHTFADRLFVSGGARVERSSVFGAKLAPRAAASLRLREGTFLRFSAGRGITEPSLLQSFARESTFVGNPSLRPEKTVSYEAGLVREWLGRRVRSEVSAFSNSFQDLIVFISLPGQPVSTWQNIEASRARGLEFSAEARPLATLAISAGYTLLSTRVLRSNTPASPVTGVGQELLRRPRHSGAVSFSLAPRRWILQAGAFLMGERQDMDGAGFGLTRSPGYQNVYAAASFRLTPHFAPVLRADNLLNSRYQEVLGYSALGRSVRGGLRIEW